MLAFLSVTTSVWSTAALALLFFTISLNISYRLLLSARRKAMNVLMDSSSISRNWTADIRSSFSSSSSACTSANHQSITS